MGSEVMMMMADRIRSDPTGVLAQLSVGSVFLEFGSSLFVILFFE